MIDLCRLAIGDHQTHECNIFMLPVIRMKLDFMPFPASPQRHFADKKSERFYLPVFRLGQLAGSTTKGFILIAGCQIQCLDVWLTTSQK